MFILTFNQNASLTNKLQMQQWSLINLLQNSICENSQIYFLAQKCAMSGREFEKTLSFLVWIITLYFYGGELKWIYIVTHRICILSICKWRLQLPQVLTMHLVNCRLYSLGDIFRIFCKFSMWWIKDEILQFVFKNRIKWCNLYQNAFYQKLRNSIK